MFFCNVSFQLVSSLF